MINQQVLQGRWTELTGKVRKKWGQVTDDDLRMAEGDVDQLVGVIQRKTGENRERIESQLEELLAGGASAVGAAAERLRETAEHMPQQLQEGYEQLSERLREGYSQAQTTVQQKPLESIAVAFGSGLIAGVIVGLVMRSR